MSNDSGHPTREPSGAKKDNGSPYLCSSLPQIHLNQTAVDGDTTTEENSNEDPQSHGSRPGNRGSTRIMDRSRKEYDLHLHQRRDPHHSAKESPSLNPSAYNHPRGRGHLLDRWSSMINQGDNRNYFERSLGQTNEGSPPMRTKEKGMMSNPNFRCSALFLVHLTLFCLITGWWIASLVLHRNDKNWIVPFLLWLSITLRLIFFYVSVSVWTEPFHSIWDSTGVRLGGLIGKKLRFPLAAVIVAAAITLCTMLSPESGDNTRVNRAVNLAGLGVLILALWVTSRNRRLINWHTVIVGILLQFLTALFVLRTKTGYDIFGFVSGLAIDLLGFAKNGVAFLTDSTVPTLPWFVLSVAPSIIFFASIASLLSYWGVLQWAVGKSAVFFFWALRVSGVEAVVAASAPFLGQGESVILIRPFIAQLTKAELHQIMCSGFAAIAGSVLVAYIDLGVNGQALISSCVMSIPASLMVSKLRYPEEEEPLPYGVVAATEEEEMTVNSVQAFSNGAWLGVKIAGIVVAVLGSVVAFVSLIDGLLTWWGSYININNLTLELILSYVLFPVVFLLGVPRNGDLLKVARLISIKIIRNEFAAYTALQTDPDYSTLSSRSRLIATYSLCGFGNIGSMGTQIGLMSQIAPSRGGDIARVAVSALIAGILSTLSSAAMAGLIITDQAAAVASSLTNGTTTS